MTAGAPSPSSERGALLSVEDALRDVLSLATPTGAELIGLDAADGRVLREDQAAHRAQPPFDAAQMDGYALASADAPSPGAMLTVIGEIAAGAATGARLERGQAIRIFTGAPMPQGADSVALQEDATREGDRVRFAEAVKAGQFVRRAGHDFEHGQALLSAPRRLSPADISLAAAMGCAWLPVARKPRVAVLAMGDELRLPGAPLDAAQIVSSNNFGVAALLRRAGAEPTLFPLLADDLDAIRAAIAAAAGHDLVLTLGGASDGDHDLAKPALTAEGAEPTFYKVAMRPGKPLMAARLGRAAVLGLPGNPVSAMVCAHIFARPLIDAFLGLAAGPAPRERLRLAADISANGPREHYARARLIDSADGRLVAPASDQDSALLSVLSAADALLVRPPLDPARAKGEIVECVLL